MFNRQQESKWFTFTVENTTAGNFREEWTVNGENLSMARRQVKEDLAMKNISQPGWKIVKVVKA